VDNHFQQYTTEKVDGLWQGKFKSILFFTSLIGLNVCLMMLSGMYWLNDAFHLFLGGNPM